MPRIVGIVLAAGRSERAGSVKALAELAGRPLVSLALDALRAGGCDEVLVVVGQPHAERIANAIDGARVVENPDPSRGMLSSLAIGIEAAESGPAPPDAVIFSLVDHPRVTARTVRRLIAMFCTDARERLALIPTHAGKAGHPVLLSRAAALAVLDAPRDETVRAAIAARAQVAHVEVDDGGVLDDADTLEALVELGARPKR